MLRACRRLLHPGGRLAFFTISVDPALSPAQHRRAVAAGPPEPTSPDLLGLAQRAGLVDGTSTDVTSEYLETARAWLTARERYRESLRVLDPADYDDRMQRGRQAVAAIERGWLRRTLVLATR